MQDLDDDAAAGLRELGWSKLALWRDKARRPDYLPREHWPRISGFDYIDPTDVNGEEDEVDLDQWR